MRLIVALTLLILSVRPASAAPLREQIDRMIAVRAGGPMAPLAGDAEFLRRVYLDLAGCIPTSDEARAFLADRDPQKREKLVDRLLAAPSWPRRIEQALTVMLLERRTGDLIPEAEWRQFLRESIAANKPWDQLIREILMADPAEPKTRPVLKFYLDGRQAEVHRLTQDVGRLFLGVDLRCAQCHDHPTVKDWKQADYYGLYAFLSGTKQYTDPKTRRISLSELPPPGKAEFESVFHPGTKSLTGPRVLGGKEIDIPKFGPSQDIAEPAREGVPPIPKLRLRQMLGSELTLSAANRFARTSVNRFWFMLMGRGLVHPLEMDHSANPPSHPELLEALTEAFIEGKYDVKSLVRAIVLSETYARSGVLHESTDPRTVRPDAYRAALSKPLSAEQLAWSVPQALGNLPELLKGKPAERPFNYRDFARGLIDPPATPDETEELFAAVFGGAPGEAEVEFQPSLGHSLFLMNEKLLLTWMEPRDRNLAARLAALKEPAAQADELYLSVLTRFPDAEEKADLAAHLGAGGTMQDLIWALLASAEFRLNH